MTPEKQNPAIVLDEEKLSIKNSIMHSEFKLSMVTIQKDDEKDTEAFQAFEQKARECSPIKKDVQLEEVGDVNELFERAHRGSILENKELFNYLQN